AVPGPEGVTLPAGQQHRLRRYRGAVHQTVVVDLLEILRIELDLRILVRTRDDVPVYRRGRHVRAEVGFPASQVPLTDDRRLAGLQDHLLEVVGHLRRRGVDDPLPLLLVAVTLQVRVEQQANLSGTRHAGVGGDALLQAVLAELPQMPSELRVVDMHLTFGPLGAEAKSDEQVKDPLLSLGGVLADPDSVGSLTVALDQMSLAQVPPEEGHPVIHLDEARGEELSFASHLGQLELLLV